VLEIVNAMYVHAGYFFKLVVYSKLDFKSSSSIRLIYACVISVL
jgi:hypothetical protein